MTLWHVQKLYKDEDPKYVVLPYDFWGSMKLKKNFRSTIKFLWISRLIEISAEKLCEEKNKKLKTVVDRSFFT